MKPTTEALVALLRRTQGRSFMEKGELRALDTAIDDAITALSASTETEPTKGAEWKHDPRIKAELLAFDEADEKLRDLEQVTLYGKAAEDEHGPKVLDAGNARQAAFYALLDSVAALAPASETERTPR